MPRHRTGLIFFYVGASCVNFMVRSSTTIYNGDGGDIDLVKILLYKLPLIYLASFTLRFIMTYVSFKVGGCSVGPAGGRVGGCGGPAGGRVGGGPRCRQHTPAGASHGLSVRVVSAVSHVCLKASS